MNAYTACEQAYNNGFAAGKEAANPFSIEMDTRVKVAYEQLGKCHTKLCRNAVDKSLCDDLQDVLNKLLAIQVRLGGLRREEDLE